MYLRCTNCNEIFNTDTYNTLKDGDPCTLKDGDPCPSCSPDVDDTSEAIYPDESGGILREWTYDIFVNVYMVDQAYGGPEEGGWWYYCGQPVESRCYDSMPEAQEDLAKLVAKYDEANKERRPISSVLSEGQYQVRLETAFAEPWPKQRPHYE